MYSLIRDLLDDDYYRSPFGFPAPPRESSRDSPYLSYPLPVPTRRRQQQQQLIVSPGDFQVMLNVKHFRPDEIDVKVVDDFVVIHGKHEEQADEHGFVTREFTRRYKIPEDVEPDNIKSSFSQNGILTVRAPRKQLAPPPKNERIVPITIQQPAGVEQQQPEVQQQTPEEKAEQ